MNSSKNQNLQIDTGLCGAEAVTENEIARVKILCKSYREKKEHISPILAEIERLENKKGVGGDPVREAVFRKKITAARDSIRDDQRDIDFFELVMLMLPDKEKLVITQLYVDGLRWDELHYGDGRGMSKSTAHGYRKNALSIMAAELRDCYSEL